MISRLAQVLIGGTAIAGLASTEYMQEKIIAILSTIPVPAFLNNISVSGLPDNTLYFINLFQIDYGLSVVITASLLKIVYQYFLNVAS